MNPQGTSFIPQRPTSGAIKKHGVKKIYVLTYISFIVFFGTIVGTAGVFGYKVLESAKLAEQKKLLTIEKERFNESEMESIRELDTQMRFAQDKLDSHVSLLPIFSSLEDSTLQSLKLDGFSYERIDAGTPSVSFSGKAAVFNSVLFQRHMLESNNIFSNAQFIEFDLAKSEVQDNEEGQSSNSDSNEKSIAFTVTAPVETTLIPFTANTANEQSMEQIDQVNSEAVDEANTEFDTIENGNAQ